MAVFDLSLANPHTQRLGTALRMLGLNVCVGCPTMYEADTLTKLLRGASDFQLLDVFDGICGVLNFAFMQLDAHLSDAKFIYIDMDEDAWLVNTQRQLQANNRSNVMPGTPLDFSTYARLMNLGCVHTDDANYLRTRYHRRRSEVTDYFTQTYPDTWQTKLLMFRIEDGWEPLCKFLDRSVPSVPFPQLPTT